MSGATISVWPFNASGAPAPILLLTINGGSSSIKFSIFSAADLSGPRIAGKIERIGLADSLFKAAIPGREPIARPITAPDHRAAAKILIEWIDRQVGFLSMKGTGHRIVHGGSEFRKPQPVTAQLLAQLQRLKPYDPEHLPSEIQLIQLFREQCPQLTQVACFDTAFHQEMPRVARLLPIPRRYDAKGVQRYGFHGLSYAFLMEELQRVAGTPAANGRIILAHLGNGASLAAVRGGKSIDTSMAFTPTAGVPMSSRSGDLDPGLIWYLERTEQMSPARFHHMVNHEAGLLGISEISPDMRDLLAKENQDIRAAEAVALFCYQIKKWIGAFAAALGGLDILVFSGGIGENAAVVRARICEGLQFLGVELDARRNDAHNPLISPESARVQVRVIRTDEEIMIAKALCQVLQL